MFKQNLEYMLIRSFGWLLLLMPESFRFWFAEMMAILVFKYVKKRREVTIGNVRLAFPELSDKEIEKLALKSYKTIFKGFMMSLWITKIYDNDKKIKIDNFELIDKLQSKNKGLVVASLHTGCVDANMAICRKVTLYTVMKAQKNKKLDRWIKDNREKTGVKVIHKGKGAIRELIKAIKNKAVVGLFSDHRDGEGVEVTFFGKKTLASSGAVNLALRYGAPMVLCYNLFNEDNSTTLYVDKVIPIFKTGDFKFDVKINTQRMINEFERVMRTYPDQYMWIHNRWRDAK